MKAKLTRGEVEAVGRVYAQLPTVDGKAWSEEARTAGAESQITRNHIYAAEVHHNIVQNMGKKKPKGKSINFSTGDAVELKTMPGKRLLVVDSGVDAVRGVWVACRETVAGLDGSRQKRHVVKPAELKVWEGKANSYSQDVNAGKTPRNNPPAAKPKGGE